MIGTQGGIDWILKAVMAHLGSFQIPIHRITQKNSLCHSNLFLSYPVLPFIIICQLFWLPHRICLAQNTLMGADPSHTHAHTRTKVSLHRKNSEMSYRYINTDMLLLRSYLHQIGIFPPICNFHLQMTYSQSLSPERKAEENWSVALKCD